MVKYPDEIFEGRTVENLPGIEYNEDDKKTMYAEDINKANGEIQAIEQTLGKNVNGDSDTVADRLNEIESLFGELEEVMDTKIAAAKSALFPVGTIYSNGVDGTNPATILGFGTWSPYAAGRVVAGKAASGTFETLGGTVGTETVSLTANQNGPHSHSNGSLTAASAGAHTHPISESNGSPGGTWRLSTYQSSGTNTSMATNSGGAHTHNVTGTTSDSGTGAAHNNIQPTVVAALWIRTA